MVKVGLLGLGFIGQLHLGGISRHGGAQVTAVADKDKKLARKTGAELGAEVFTSADELIAKAEVDVIDLCLPTPFHRKYTELAAAAGHHVFCEKPFALTVADAEAMIAACDSAGVKLMIAHVLRFFPPYVAARNTILSGDLGRAGVARTFRGGPFPSWASDNWFADPDKSGGVIVDLAIHDIDYLRWCFGEIKRVFVRTASPGDANIDLHALILARFRSGQIAHMEASWATPSDFPFTMNFEIATSGGMITYDNNETTPVKVYGEGAAFPPMPDDDPYGLQIKAFADAVAADRPVPIDPVDSLETLKAALAAVQSGRTGSPVEL